MHFEVIFQLLMCGPDAAATPVVGTNGLNITFDHNLTPKQAFYTCQKPRYFSYCRHQAKIMEMIFLTAAVCVVVVVVFHVGMVVVVVMVVRMVGILNERLAQYDFFKWVRVPPPLPKFGQEFKAELYSSQLQNIKNGSQIPQFLQLNILNINLIKMWPNPQQCPQY